MASIRERAGSWRVEWRRGGRAGSRESCTFPTGQQAEGARRLVEARHHNITDAEVYAAVLGLELDGRDRYTPTVAEWAVTWLASRRRIGEVQADTVDGHQSIVTRRILPRLGPMPLNLITPDVVRDWVEWLVEQPSRRGGTLDADTVRRAHGVLHSLLGAAVPKWLASNPAAKPPGRGRRGDGLPRATPHEPTFLTSAEVELILQHAHPAIAGLVFVAVRTGLRLGELLALRVLDVNLTPDRRVIQVRRAMKRGGGFGPPKSRRSRRDVWISEAVASRLEPLVCDRPGEALVFTAPRGGAWNPANLTDRYWLPSLAAAQRCPEHPPPLPPKPKTGPRRALRPGEVSTCDCPTRLRRRPRFHDLRHTHASLCAEAGWPMLRVSRRLGHESIQITADLYGSLWDGESTERLDGLEDLLNPDGPA